VSSPIWGSWPDIYYSLTVTVLFFWGDLSDERTGLSFYMLLALASVVFLGSESCGTRDHILLSQIWDFPFRRLLRLTGSRWRYSTPPPHGWLFISSQSHSYVTTDGQSASRSWCQVPIWGLWPYINYCLTYTVLSFGGRPLWREDGSVVCQSASSIRSIVSMYNFCNLHVSHVIEYICNIYKASVSPGSVSKLCPISGSFPLTAV
jgi:hypothetical protein